MAFSAKIVGDELVLRIPMNAKPEKSSSGKTLVRLYLREQGNRLRSGRQESDRGRQRLHPEEVGADGKPCGFPQVVFDNPRFSRVGL